MRGVHSDYAEVAGQQRSQNNVFSNQAGEQFFNTSDYLVQGKDARLQSLRPRNCQQLLNHFGPMLSRSADLLRVMMGTAVLFELSNQEVAVEHDAGEKIVEIVRHSTRQPAHGFQALRLSHFGLGFRWSCSACAQDLKFFPSHSKTGTNHLNLFLRTIAPVKRKLPAGADRSPVNPAGIVSPGVISRNVIS